MQLVDLFTRTFSRARPTHQWVSSGFFVHRMVISMGLKHHKSPEMGAIGAIPSLPVSC